MTSAENLFMADVLEMKTIFIVKSNARKSVSTILEKKDLVIVHTQCEDTVKWFITF